MNSCKTCFYVQKLYDKDGFSKSPEFWKCLKSPRIDDPVTGERRAQYCMVERMNGGHCKPEGLLYRNERERIAEINAGGK